MPPRTGQPPHKSDERFQEPGAILRLDHHRLVVPLEQVSKNPEAPIETLRAGAFQPFHSSHQVAFLRLDHRPPQRTDYQMLAEIIFSI